MILFGLFASTFAFSVLAAGVVLAVHGLIKTAKLRHTFLFSSLVSIVAFPIAVQFLPGREVMVIQGAHHAPATMASMIHPVVALLPAVYMIVAGSLILRIIYQFVSLRRMIRSSRKLRNDCSEQRYTLLESAAISVPHTFWFGRHYIVIPENLDAYLSPAELNALIEHEIAHIQRGDFSKNLFGKLVHAILWPNPLLPILLKKIDFSRELATDELAVQKLEKKELLLSALARLSLLPRHSQLSMAASGGEILNRLKTLQTDTRHTRQNHKLQLVLLSILVGASFSFGTYSISKYRISEYTVSQLPADARRVHFQLTTLSGESDARISSGHFVDMTGEGLRRKIFISVPNP